MTSYKKSKQLRWTVSSTNTVEREGVFGRVSHLSPGSPLNSPLQPLQVTIDVERTIQHDEMNLDADSNATSDVDLGFSHKHGNDGFSDIKRQ